MLAHAAGQDRSLRLSGEEIAELSALYRAICFDLSLVQSRDWGTSMSRYLNGLVAEGHNCLYRSQPGSWGAIIRFLFQEFPRLLRANFVYFWISCALFVIPGVVCGFVVARDTSQASRLLSGSNLAMFEEMYSREIGARGDDSSSVSSGAESAMAGFYVQHNVGIAFKCFALGVFAGIGTAKELVFNSIVLGTVTGFLIGRGHSAHFFEFVISHSSFELTAIVVAGAAGLIMGHALVHPGQVSRGEALRLRGLDAVKLALGAGFMLCVAALIEGFWSPSVIPRGVKMTGGAFFWILVILYLGLAGRTRRSRTTVASTERAS